MIKLCKNLVSHILEKWPLAELYVHDGNTVHENEITIINANNWFISLSFMPGKVSAIIYTVTGNFKAPMGYCYLKEYQISHVQKDKKYPTWYLNKDADKRLVKVYWSLSELINHIESDVYQSTAQLKSIKHRYKSAGNRSTKR